MKIEKSLQKIHRFLKGLKQTHENLNKEVGSACLSLFDRIEHHDRKAFAKIMELDREFDDLNLNNQFDSAVRTVERALQTDNIELRFLEDYAFYSGATLSPSTIRHKIIPGFRKEKEIVIAMVNELSYACKGFPDYAKIHHDLTSLVKTYYSRWALLMNIAEKIVSIGNNMDRFYKVKKGLMKKQYNKTKKKKFRIKIYHSRLNLTIINKFDAEISRPFRNGPWLDDTIQENCTNILDKTKDERVSKRVLEIKAMSIGQVQDDIFEFFAQHVLHALHQIRYIYRSSHVNMYIVFLPESEVEGSYHKLRSNFSNIFLEIAFTPDLLAHYYFGTYSDSVLNTIMHEVRHACDWTLNKDVIEFSKTFGENFDTSVSNILDVLSKLRSEGNASFYAFFHNKILVQDPAIFAFDELFEGYGPMENARNHFERYFDAAATKTGFADLAPSSHIIYSFGTFMVFMITLRHLHSVDFVISRENEDPLKIRHTKVKNFMHKGSGLHFIIKPLEYATINQVLSKIDIMNVPTFIESYIEACHHFNIDPSPISKKNFERINKFQSVSFDSFVKKIGF